MRKRSPLTNKVLNKYMNMDEYFETINGKHLWEYLKTNKPLVMIFTTRAGQIIGVEYKQFVEPEVEVDIVTNVKKPAEEYGKSIPIKKEDIEFKYPDPKDESPAFKRPPDPMSSFIEEPEKAEEESEDLKIGDNVKYRDGIIQFIGTVVDIDETNQIVQVEENGSTRKVKFADLISIV